MTWHAWYHRLLRMVMLERFCKTSLVAALALFMGLVAVNNLLDPSSNFAFVQHVLSMDTVASLRGRALTSPVVHHLLFATIIAWEAATALLCGVGAGSLAYTCRRTAASFHRAKTLAAAGLVVGLLLWLVAFLTVGGEWFLMWQSPTWNGQNAAFRMFAVTALVLLYLKQSEIERGSSDNRDKQT